MKLAALIGHIPLMVLLAGGIAILLLGTIFVLTPKSIPTSHGGARWASKRETQSFVGGGGPILGRSMRGEILSYPGDAPLITIAPPRSGKGVGLIIPTLLHSPRSILVIDPKGEAARATAARRAQFGPVYILDPFRAAGGEAAYNPLDRLDPEAAHFHDEAATLAESLVKSESDHSSDASEHFNSLAQALLEALVMFCVAAEPPEFRHLGQVRRYMGLPAEQWQALLNLMSQSNFGNGLVARRANQHLARDAKESAYTLSSMQRHTKFLDSEAIVATLNRSDFQFAALKKSPATVFLVLPPERLDAYSRWLRLLFTSAINEFAIDPVPPKFGSVELIVDEAAALGRLGAIERAMAFMPGYGLQPWLFWQDMAQLRGAYQVRAESLIAECGIVQFFDVVDYSTAEYVSKMAGQKTVQYWEGGTGVPNARGQRSGPQRHRVARALLTPDEVRTFPRDQMIVFPRGIAPIRARKIRWWADAQFRSLGRNERS